MNKNISRCPNCLRITRTEFLFSKNNFEIIRCTNCKNSYTHPVPKNLSHYYHSKYWLSKGFLGKLKTQTFELFQKRRINWLKKYAKNQSNVLEIGSGEGEFLNTAMTSYKIIGIEFPGSNVKNQKILKVDFLSWKTQKKFNTVIFWESLEHVPSPQKYLQKAHKFLNKKGYVLIELPRFNALEAQIFKEHWFHLDPPRHLAHMTDNGIRILAKRAGFKVMERKSVLAPEYTIWGLASSIGDFFGLTTTDTLKKRGFSLVFLAYIPLLILALLIQPLFYLFDQSPISFVALKKI